MSDVNMRPITFKLKFGGQVTITRFAITAVEDGVNSTEVHTDSTSFAVKETYGEIMKKLGWETEDARET